MDNSMPVKLKMDKQSREKQKKISHICKTTAIWSSNQTRTVQGTKTLVKSSHEQRQNFEK